MALFLAVRPTSHDRFRAPMLFGRDVASYKFALAKALLEVARGGAGFGPAEELADPYTRHLRTHLAQAPKQGTSRSSCFLKTCKGTNAGTVSDDGLRSITISLGFNNVIDASHRLGAHDVGQRFFLDERAAAGGIRLTDALRHLAHDPAAADLGSETPFSFAYISSMCRQHWWSPPPHRPCWSDNALAARRPNCPAVGKERVRTAPVPSGADHQRPG